MPQNITAVGNLVKDPEVKTFEKGSLTKLRIACTDRMSDGNGGWKDGDTNFYDVAVWKTLGEYAASSLKKGDKVIICSYFLIKESRAKKHKPLKVFFDNKNNITRVEK